MRRIPALGALLVCLSGRGLAAGADCSSAQHFLDAAQEKANAYAFEEAADLAQKSADACASYDAFESLAELRSHAPTRSQHARAVDAYLAAYPLATDDHERAQTLFQYARLLDADGDPQNASPLIERAKALDPENQGIAAFATQIEDRLAHPTSAQLERGLWNTLYKPLTMDKSAAPSAPSPSSITKGPSVSIPINFETNTTTVDAQTRANVATLASVLSEPSHAKQRFLFIGHADVRGSEEHNIVLSKQRAEVISQAVIRIETTLQGRIEVDGRGSSEPLDSGHDERAYRANRRLQVVLQ